MSDGSSSITDSPAHHHSPSMVGTSLQMPAVQGGQSSSSTQRSFDQSKSRASTRQSDVSGSTSSGWTSASGVSQASTNSPLRPYFYPTSGYPVSKSVLQQAYPGNGYPVSQLNHSYGYPSANFPCCEVPGATDLRSQLFYPSSEFPGGGAFPGEIEQDDGSAPYISGLEGPHGSDPAPVFVGSGPFPPSHTSLLPPVDTLYTPGSFDPHYNSGYPL